jgi:hypothetical protein
MNFINPSMFSSEETIVGEISAKCFLKELKTGAREGWFGSRSKGTA